MSYNLDTLEETKIRDKNILFIPAKIFLELVFFMSLTILSANILKMNL